jgi:ketosteroid isomerase-like protein
MEDVRGVLAAYAEGWRTGDPGLFDYYADDCRFHYFGTSDQAGTHVGKDACLAAMITVSTRAPRTLLEIVDVLVGEHGNGALLVRERIERDGESHEITRLMRYRISGGKVAECWVYDEAQALIDRLWRP